MTHMRNGTRIWQRQRLTVIVLVMATMVGLMAHMPRSRADADSFSYVWRNVEIGGGGYVPAIIFNASEPDLVYARTDIGGAYRWNRQTLRWQPLLDWVGWSDWGLTGVDSLATDALDPDRVYVLAGTYTNAWDPANGAVLRSHDRGRTWQRANLPFKSGGNMPGRNMGERLAIDPNDNRILYLGARSGKGLWRSRDFGETWTRVTSFPATGTYVQDRTDASGYLSDPQGVTWIVFDPRTGTPHGLATQTIYAGVADLGQSIYRSTDGGATWQPLAGQPTSPALMPHHAALASTGTLFVTYNNNGGPFDGSSGDVWKYATATGIWRRISPVSSDPGTGIYFGYGGLAVDAQHPDTVMVAALNSWWPDTIIWRSLDAGAHWSQIWDWGPWPTRVLRYTQDISKAPWLTFGVASELPVLSPRLGWMVGDLKIDPFNSNRMLYGTGATIYGSDNVTNWDGGTAINISVKAGGLEETSVQDLISPPEGAPLLSALGDIGGFRHDNLSVVPSTMFTNPIVTTTTSLDFAELNPQVVVRTGAGGNAGNVGFSSDGGTTWTAAGSEPAGGPNGGVIAISANGGSAVWSPSNADVSYTTNQGASWTASAGVPRGARVASDRVRPQRFYAFANGLFFVSEDTGATFVATAASTLPASGPVRFKAVPGRDGHVWLAGGDAASGTYGLWFSTDAGATFTKLANVQEADTIGYGRPARPDRYPVLYTSAKIGGIRGIYRSEDSGASWLRINDDQHQYAFTGTAITGDPRVYGRVYLATNGRGIIYGEPGLRRTNE
jgi:xyloglucan-specific exo-beta-1,4-glucanase